MLVWASHEVMVVKQKTHPLRENPEIENGFWAKPQIKVCGFPV